MARLLIDCGANVNLRGGSLNFGSVLGAAVLSRDADIVQLLVDRGACVNSWSSYSPLHIAARTLAYSCVEILLKAGALPNARGEQYETPLYLSVHYLVTEALPRDFSIGVLIMLL